MRLGSALGQVRMAVSAYLLRRCEFRDLDQVGNVEVASFPDHPYSKLDFVSCLSVAREGFIVARKDDSVVGYVIATVERQEGSIQSIAVSPEFREKGVGETLMRSAVDHLTGRCKRARLLVGASNERAIRLYRKLSFKETGNTIKKYYPNGDDAVEMAREL
jgi:[ribosomal protein S18]-alanine N-acetyltransferase